MNSSLPTHLKSILLLLLGLVLPMTLVAQDFEGFEDDSLLFGEEFDLGGDLDFDLGGTESDTSLGLDGESGELDDWLSGFDDEAETDDTTSSDDSDDAGDDWGFLEDSGLENLGGGDGYEDNALFEELPDHPLDFRKRVRGTLLQDTGLTLSFFSPQVVAAPLDTWYSFLDLSLNIDAPYHLEIEGVHINFSLDISTFNFSNTFPAGGQFRGVSVVPMARAEFYGVEVETGLGLYYPSFGALAGIGYSYQFHSLFTSVGYRWNWVSNIEPIGSSWWLEPRFTIGLKFW
jgi:hypothetical protein